MKKVSFLLLLFAILLIGGGCAAWSAEPYGRHGLIDIGGSGASGKVADVPPKEVKPAPVVKDSVPPVPVPEMKKTAKKVVRTVKSSAKKSVATGNGKPASSAHPPTTWCILCVIQTQTK